MRKTIALEQRNQVCVMTLVREDELNTVTMSFLQEFRDCLDNLRDDPTCRVVIVTGMGKVFCAGAELKEVMHLDAIQVRNFMEKAVDAFDAVESLPQVTIAAINGHALGGGAELALACDFRIMSESASFGLPEVKLGAIPVAGGVQRLPRLIGKAKATELVLLGNRISAAQAEQYGLLYRTVPAERLLDEAFALAERLLENSPVAMCMAKSCLNVACDSNMRTANRHAVQCISSCFASEDQREGMQAFFDRRRPDWHGFGNGNSAAAGLTSLESHGDDPIL